MSAYRSDQDELPEKYSVEIALKSSIYFIIVEQSQSFCLALTLAIVENNDKQKTYR